MVAVIFRERRELGGGELRGGEAYHETAPQKRCWTPPPRRIRSNPLRLRGSGTDPTNPTFGGLSKWAWRALYSTFSFPHNHMICLPPGGGALPATWSISPSLPRTVSLSLSLSLPLSPPPSLSLPLPPPLSLSESLSPLFFFFFFFFLLLLLSSLSLSLTLFSLSLSLYLSLYISLSLSLSCSLSPSLSVYPRTFVLPAGDRDLETQECQIDNVSYIFSELLGKVEAGQMAGSQLMQLMTSPEVVEVPSPPPRFLFLWLMEMGCARICMAVVQCISKLWHT